MSDLRGTAALIALVVFAAAVHYAARYVYGTDEVAFLLAALLVTALTALVSMAQKRK